ncbi:hypothetical protein [Hymenobacter gelipurpurascens]|uniref:hypothetical protein n=1 Tax=Hymenobacter gelipurpurascens TaxID=89968 RepID=UPI001132580C|nr:hypothetical protein [Hymenobacter gelipurpurascens]
MDASPNSTLTRTAVGGKESSKRSSAEAWQTFSNCTPPHSSRTLEPNGALYPSLPVPFEELAFAIVEQINLVNNIILCNTMHIKRNKDKKISFFAPFIFFKMQISITQEIDCLISTLYQAKKNYGELEALSILISQKFISGLEEILNKRAPRFNSYREKYKVSLGWIDKVPLAKCPDPTLDYNKNPFSAKVEIGDLLIINTAHDISSGRKYSVASIIQAKITDISPFNTPVKSLSNTSASSTSKQLALLSKWPIFDLYKTSGNDYPVSNLMQLDIGINMKGNKSKFMGYYNQKWWCGFPDFGDPCDITLGSHFQSIAANKDGFTFNLKSHQNDWDKLINGMLSICDEYNLPEKHYGTQLKKRVITSNFLLYETIANSAKISQNFTLGLNMDDRRFPIILIDRVMAEGLDITRID